MPTNAAPARRPRASLYIRLSRQSTTENLSLAGMESDLRKLADKLRADVAAVHVDDGLSGAVRNRPEFRAWLADAREGRADILAAWHVDRMTREGLPVAAMLLDVTEGSPDPDTGKRAHAPVRLVDCHGLDSDNKEGFRLLFVVRAEIARAERDRTSARNKALADRLREAGLWRGGVAPYGYRVVPADGDHKTLDVDPAEAEVIRDCARRVLDGEPLRRVVRSLNVVGVKPRRAAAWTHTTLWQVLTGEAVLGRRTHGARVVRKATGEAEQVWPPVLTVAESAALRRVLARGQARPASRITTRLLHGLAVCGTCGTPLRAGTTNGATRYRCDAAPGVCNRRVLITAARLDEHVAGYFLSTWGAAPLYVRRTVPGEAAEELARVADTIAATLAELATDADPAAFARLRALQGRQRQLEAAPTATRDELVPTGRTLAEEWNALDGDDEARRALLAGPIAAVEVYGTSKGRPAVADRVAIVPRDDADDLADDAA